MKNDELIKDQEQVEFPSADKQPIDIPIADALELMFNDDISSVGARQGAKGSRQGALGKGRKSRGSMKKKKTKEKAGKGTILMIWIIILAICAVVAHFSITTATDFRSGRMQLPSKVIVVASNSSTADIAELLERNGIIGNAFAFRVSSRLMGYDGKYNAGEFEIQQGSGYKAIMEQLTTTTGIQKLTLIREGDTSKEAADAIAANTSITAEQFLEAANGEYDFAFLPKTQRKDSLEGYLFPDTYHFTEMHTADDMVETMLRRFDEIFTDEYKMRAKELGMSIDEVVILASIIEAEVGTDADRAKVSGVFHNRLNSNPPMKLQSCATVNYVLGEYKEVLSDADTQIDSPYNTYICKGLPIGPICNPGEAAIKAALYPEIHDYLFFQSEKGETYYTKTGEEHEKMKKEIQE